MIIHIDVPALIHNLKEADAVDPCNSFGSEESVRNALSDGAIYLWDHVIKQLLVGDTVTLHQIDYSAFTQDDIQEVSGYYDNYVALHYEMLIKFRRIYAPFDESATLTSSVKFM